MSATADAELAAETAARGQEGCNEQEPDLLTAAHELMVTGDVGGGQKVEGLPASVVALISLYESDFYWWEAVECVRKVLLVGVLVFSPSPSSSSSKPCAQSSAPAGSPACSAFCPVFSV